MSEQEIIIYYMKSKNSKKNIIAYPFNILICEQLTCRKQKRKKK